MPSLRRIVALENELEACVEGIGSKARVNWRKSVSGINRLPCRCCAWRREVKRSLRDFATLDRWFACALYNSRPVSQYSLRIKP